MIVLGIETSTLVAGVAIVKKDKVISEHFINNQKTHSQNLMPMIKEVLAEGGINPQDLGGIAIAKGPGSFTGLRIGMATAKTLAQVLNIPIVGVPTLDALANNVIGFDGLICPILDAKKNQVYTAIYKASEGEIRPRSEYLAISLEDLMTQIKLLNEKALFLGDGVPVFREQIKEQLGNSAEFANIINSLPRGASVAQLGLKLLEEGKGEDSITLEPLYIRQSEAEINWEKRRAQCQ